MFRNATFLLATLSLGLMLSACERIQERDLVGEQIDFGPKIDNVPLEYGRLVSTAPLTPYTAVLWFEQADQSLIGVRVNVARGTISEAVVKIERR